MFCLNVEYRMLNTEYRSILLTNSKLTSTFDIRYSVFDIQKHLNIIRALYLFTKTPFFIQSLPELEFVRLLVYPQNLHFQPLNHEFRYFVLLPGLRYLVFLELPTEL